MLRDVLKCDNLGSAEEILFVLFDALPHADLHDPASLEKYCNTGLFSLSRSFRGILKLLEFVSFVRVVDGRLNVDRTLAPRDVELRNGYFNTDHFFTALFSALDSEGRLGEFFFPGAIRWDADLACYYVKDNLIPLKFIALRNLLISLGFLARGVLLNRNNLIIPAQFTPTFRRAIIARLESAAMSRRKLSLLTLQEKLAAQEKAGKEAESFVVNFEKRRLNESPLTSKIRKISDEFVNAGYDIESLNATDSALIDRFIEVKSFAGKIEFFWSRNEMVVAAELAESYFLYLVDRSLMSITGYEPLIIRNPHKILFADPMWHHETESAKFSLRTLIEEGLNKFEK